MIEARQTGAARLLAAATPHLDPERELVAYLCAEFAVDERLPLYAGGLGVLAGDHLKTASDLGLPLIAVGLLYREGYLRQRLDEHGQQHADSDGFDPAGRGLEVMRNALGGELRVHVPLGDHALQVRVWRAMVGRVPLFLLDADCPENHPDDRRITARLYGGGHDTRLLQEIILGIGGVRALRGMGLRPAIWHLNEGHAAFAALERVRELVANGLSFSASLEIVAASTVFTTHTPVPAGHDVFTHAQLHHWLGDYFGSLHTTERRLLSLGADAQGSHRFSMTAFALRVSRFRNGVSRIHRDVAARMESYAWPLVSPADVPIRYVENAVHVPTFLAPEWASRFDSFRPDWRRRVLDDVDCAWIDALPDGEFDEVRRALRHRLLGDLRQRLIRQHQRNDVPSDSILEIVRALEPGTIEPLVIGFARRFATYKRATLLFSDEERLLNWLHQDRPILMVFAGKAHPHDSGGQHLLRVLHEHSLRREYLGRLLVVEGYDLGLARSLVQGCDVWLNTPEYPLEASGTSGMKSAINGGVNVSILDGWWADGWDGENGYGIAPRADLGHAQHERDQAESGLIMDVLERQVVPTYFDDPAAWRRMSRRSMRTLIPRYASTRMLRDYVQRFYAPAARQGERLNERNCRASVEFVRWRKMLHAQAAGLKAEVVNRNPLTVVVELNGLRAADIGLEVDDGQAVAPLTLQSTDLRSAVFALPGPAPAGGKVRILPQHPLLADRYELGCLAVIGD